MAEFEIQTDLVLDQEGNSTQDMLDDFRVPLAAMSGNAIEVGTGGVFTKISDKNQMMADLADGTIKFAFGSANRLPTGSDEFLFAHIFGMEVQEFFSWYHAGGGAALIETQLAALGSPNDDVMFFPIACRGPESGCWAKEQITLKKFNDGKWSDGTTVNMRLADEAKPAFKLAFPNCEIPGSTPTVSFLGDVFNKTFNAAEFNEPVGDAGTTNTLFPAWPLVDGSIVDAGLKHYYMGSWHTPYRGRSLYINRTWYLSRSTAEQAMIQAAAARCSMHQMADTLQGNDAIIKAWQDMGVRIYESMPTDVLMALRESVDEIYRQWSSDEESPLAAIVGSPTADELVQIAQYREMLAHQQAFIRANQVRWRAGTVDQRMRFHNRRDYAGDLQPNG
jgi:hypothetical protein